MSVSPNGATGSGPSNSKKTTKKRMNGVQLTNGHHEEVTTSPLTNGHVESYAESTSSSTTSGYDSPNGCEESRHHPAVNGHPQVQLVYSDPKTVHIVKRIFYKLLSASNVDRETVRCFEMSEHALSRVQGYTVIRKVSDFTTEYILTSEHTIQVLIQDFRTQHWDILPTTLQSEYRRVTVSMFSDKVTWGRVISFLRFAVAYAIYVHGRGMGRAVQSIEAWTVEVIQEELGTFFTENNGWEGFMEYVEASVRAQRKLQPQGQSNRTHHPDTQDPSFWQGVYAIGAVAVGAAAAFTLRQAFS